MSFILSLCLAGGFGALAGAPAVATGEALAAASFSQAGKRKPRRAPRRAAPPPEPEMPPLDDLPLGAQDLLPASAKPADAEGTGKPRRAAAPRPMDSYDFGAPPREAGAPGEAEGGSSPAEAAPAPEEVWRQALEEARRELREAQAEKQRQENADNPTPPEEDAAPRIVKARETIRRLLEEGKAKQYREQP